MNAVADLGVHGNPASMDTLEMPGDNTPAVCSLSSQSTLTQFRWVCAVVAYLDVHRRTRRPNAARRNKHREGNRNKTMEVGAHVA